MNLTESRALMGYVALYRKWRPQTFGEVVGQDHIVGTLTNAIQTGQVHHALLFTGTRGTGKTTTARLIAKALNCERGPTAEPCNQCESCRSIMDGTSLDVVEIDAASHGSVDDARDLRERANYAPAAARYKVYIVDEAHMVTPQGFNAMLKVLEEPPEHVRFMFCTTEPHKVIEAIRSRCQRHDFRRVRSAVLVDYFGKICAAEGIDIEPSALELIVKAADGSVRDGLSRLDQVLTFAGTRVTHADVARVLGVLPVELRFELADALAGHRVGDVLACVEQVVQAGHDLHQFAREALEHLRDLYVLKVAPESTTLVDTTAETRERLAAQAARFGPGELGRLLRILGDVYQDLRTATDQRLVLEVGLARAAMPEASLDADALLARIERLERRLAITVTDDGSAPAPPLPTTIPTTHSGHSATSPSGGPPEASLAASRSPARGVSTAPSAPSGAISTIRGEGATRDDPPSARPPAGGSRPRAVAAGKRVAATAASNAATEVDADWSAAEPSGPAAPLDFGLVERSWSLVIQRVRAGGRVVASYLEHGRPVALEGRQVVVEYAPKDRFYAEALGKDGRSAKVDAALQAVLGGGLTVRLVIGESSPATGSGEAAAPAAVAAAAPASPPPAPETSEPPPVEFEIDPEHDAGEPLDSDADARAVADWAARELGGQVIEERPNPKGRGARGKGSASRARG
jgi:DNA polymerase-3 subunit gamma/tau